MLSRNRSILEEVVEQQTCSACDIFLWLIHAMCFNDRFLNVSESVERKPENKPLWTLQDCLHDLFNLVPVSNFISARVGQIKSDIWCRRKNLYYYFLLVLVFHSFVLGVYFLVFISVLCQLPVLYLLYLFAYRIYIGCA